MPRKFTASESQLKPDARYQDKVVAKFINCMMYGGQKGPATRVVYDAFVPSASAEPTTRFRCS